MIDTDFEEGIDFKYPLGVTEVNLGSDNHSDIGKFESRETVEVTPAKTSKTKTYSRKSSAIALLESLKLPGLSFESDDHLLFDDSELAHDEALSSPLKDSILDSSGVTESELSPSEEKIDFYELESVVKSLMSDASVSWSIKQWYAEISNIMDIKVESSELKQRIKSLIFDEGEVFVSQTQQSQVDAIFNDNGEESEDEDFLIRKSKQTNDDDSSVDFDAPRIKKSKRKKREEISRDSDSSDYDTSDQDEELNLKTKITKKKLSGLKNIAEASEAIVNQEMEVVKQLEKGPSEDDIRRIEATEIDEDEVKERIERFQKLALLNLTACAGISISEQKKLMKECHDWLQLKYSDPKLRTYIDDDIRVTVQRIYKGADYDVLGKINSFKNFILNHLEEDDTEQLKAKVENLQNEEELVILTDSENESQDDDTHKENFTVKQHESRVPIVFGNMQINKESKQTLGNTFNGYGLTDKKKLKEEFDRRRNDRIRNSKQLGQCIRKPLSDRSSMLIALSKKVHEKANENHCKIERVKDDNLEIRLDISKRCRQLIEMFKLDEDRKRFIQAKKREQKRNELKEKFRIHANDDDGEFDDDYDAFKEVTEEEQLEIIRRAQTESCDEEADEDEEEEEDEVSSEEDLEVTEEVQPSALDEEEEESSNETDFEEPNPINDGSNKIDVSENEEEKPKNALIRYGRRSRIIVDDGFDNSMTEDISGEADSKSESAEEKSKIDPIAVSKSDNGDLSSSSDEESSGEESSDPESDKYAATKEKKPSKIKNTQYRLQLLEEERRHRQEKSRHSSLLELEAEEEEEEGAQAGLGDFGFKFNKKDLDDESDALKLRQGDLDHIVDDVDDDEGDEEAGLKARLEMQQREEKAQTKAIITAITEGHDAAKRLIQNKNSFSFEDLINNDEEAEARKRKLLESENQEEDFDEEEMLLKGLQSRRDREQKDTHLRNEFDDIDEEEEAEEEADIDLAALASMTEEERTKEEAMIQRRREQQRAAMLKRKEFEEYTRMRRALRRAHSVSQQSTQLDDPLQSKATALLQPAVTLSLEKGPSTFIGTTNLPDAKKRRTSLPPKHYEGKPQRVHTVNSNVKAKSSAFKGTIDSAELLGGYGMGMAVTSVNARRTLSAISNSGTELGLFSTVTGIVNSHYGTGSAMDSNKLKRSFTNVRKVGLSGTGVVHSAQHFVYMDETSQNTSVTMAASRGSISRAISSNSTCSQSASNSHALFSKLKERSTSLKRTATISN